MCTSTTTTGWGRRVRFLSGGYLQSHLEIGSLLPRLMCGLSASSYGKFSPWDNNPTLLGTIMKSWLSYVKEVALVTYDTLWQRWIQNLILGTLEKPVSCPLPIQDLMSRCWSYLPDDRPSFLECLSTIQEFMLTKQTDWVGGQQRQGHSSLPNSAPTVCSTHWAQTSLSSSFGSSTNITSEGSSATKFPFPPGKKNSLKLIVLFLATLGQSIAACSSHRHSTDTW